MQRLFSSFPDGRPGLGLLLLRAAVGGVLVLQGGAWLAGRALGPWTWAAGPLAIAAGAALLLGFFTPVASLLAVLDGLGAALSLLPPSLPAASAPTDLLLALMAAAVFLLGPGAFSLDARRFGRREVVIPLAPTDADSGA